ncbi:hypothetical protein ASC95_08590 [Pelomonas sp. Root1217]|nr:hypothetical protein ASC95_08590 [Pelomonas sp. Root1217]
MGFWVFIGIWVTLNVAATRALLRAAAVGFERPGSRLIEHYFGSGIAGTPVQLAAKRDWFEPGAGHGPCC